MTPLDDLPPGDDDLYAAFPSLVAKLSAVGWIDRSAIRPEFGDVRLTDRGSAALASVYHLDRLLGGLDAREAALLFFLAKEFNQPGAE